MPHNDLNPSIVKFVMKNYYNQFMQTHYDDLFSYGLEALYRADLAYDPTKTTQQFKYFATCLIRKAMYTFVRDRLTKTYQNTSYTDKTSVLEQQKVSYLPSEEILDLRNAIKTLPDKYKVIIKTLYYEGYSITDATNVLHLSRETITRRRNKALQLLKENL